MGFITVSPTRLSNLSLQVRHKASHQRRGSIASDSACEALCVVFAAILSQFQAFWKDPASRIGPNESSTGFSELAGFVD
jgi:hypothetical protein